MVLMEFQELQVCQDLMVFLGLMELMVYQVLMEQREPEDTQVILIDVTACSTTCAHTKSSEIHTVSAQLKTV